MRIKEYGGHLIIETRHDFWRCSVWKQSIFYHDAPNQMTEQRCMNQSDLYNNIIGKVTSIQYCIDQITL